MTKNKKCLSTLVIKNKPTKMSGFIFSRGSRITTSTLFTRLQQALKLKFAPLFAPLTNLLKQT